MLLSTCPLSPGGMNPPTGSRQLSEVPAAETSATELDGRLLVVATGAPPQAASNTEMTARLSVCRICPGWQQSRSCYKQSHSGLKQPDSSRAQYLWSRI